jgi:glycosyltransferase involved in cell wall biosynthesis
MLRCTYIVFIHNNQDNIPQLVESLKQTTGNFSKEFIFIDDGSNDNSLSVLKIAANDIPRVTIITQEMQGSTISINKALNLATGEYIHFVEGNEKLHIDSSSELMKACLELGTEVAVGLTSLKDVSSNKITGSSKIIANPIKQILTGKPEALSNIGKAGSMVRSKLLEKTGKADSSIYTHNMSLSLRCAKYTKFAFLNKAISTVSNVKSNPKSKFNSYNNLKSIYNFVQDNPIVFSGITSDLLYALKNNNIGKYKKASYTIMFFISKYIKSMSLNKVLTLYKQELAKLV